MIKLYKITWLFSCFPHDIFCLVERFTERSRSWDIVENHLISTPLYDRVLLFYDPLGSQWLCRPVQFSPHLILFYSTLARFTVRQWRWLDGDMKTCTPLSQRIIKLNDERERERENWNASLFPHFWMPCHAAWGSCWTGTERIESWMLVGTLNGSFDIFCDSMMMKELL